MQPLTNLPLATSPLHLQSYRYRTRYGWIMIGASSPSHALKEAERSLQYPNPNDPCLSNLQKWNGTSYEQCTS